MKQTATPFTGLIFFQSHAGTINFGWVLPILSMYLSDMKQPAPTDLAVAIQLLVTTFNKLNETDLRILLYLSQARIAFNCVICKHLSLDPSHCHRRLRRLVASGLIEVDVLGKRKIYRFSANGFRQLGITVPL